MPAPYRRYAPDQDFLLPPSLRDWLPEGHLAYFIADVVGRLDLQAFHDRYAEGGPRNQPFDPGMMVRVLLYAYATGTFSSRRIARKLEEDVAYRVLAAGNLPAHRTIADFRAQHLEAFEGLFAQVVRIARETGAKRLGTLAVDGTRLRANASKHKAMSYGRMRDEEVRLKREIAELTTRAARQDAAEDCQHGEARGDELPAELRRREQRLRAIEAAKARVEARQAEADRERGRTREDERQGRGRKRFARDFGVPEDKAQENFTDPDSRIMKTGEGFQQCYNAQAAVEAGTRLIVAAELSNCAADGGQLVGVVEAAEAATGRRVRTVLADAGYRSEDNFNAMARRRTRAYIALGREGTTAPPAGPPLAPATRRMMRRMASPEGRENYRMRKAIAEPAFGWIKRCLGFRQFSLRGERKAQGEWRMICTAINLRRMPQLQPAP